MTESISYDCIKIKRIVTITIISSIPRTLKGNIGIVAIGTSKSRHSCSGSPACGVFIGHPSCPYSINLNSV
jgi:hypothetical protein